MHLDASARPSLVGLLFLTYFQCQWLGAAELEAGSSGIMTGLPFP